MNPKNDFTQIREAILASRIFFLHQKSQFFDANFSTHIWAHQDQNSIRATVKRAR
jgi:hypothetical protein